jgi:hypothetical protein
VQQAIEPVGYVDMRYAFAIILLFAANGYSQDLHVHLRGKAKGTVNITANGDTLEARIWSQKGLVRGLKQEDFIVTQGGDTATIISFNEVTSESTADVAFTFILDNSGSMFHAYDSLTKYLDEFVDLIGEGAAANVITFDNVERKPNYEGVRKNRIFIALSGFTEDKQEMKDFWHFYDTIRSDFTPLYDGTVSGLLAIRDRRKLGDVARHEIVMVITDGSDNISQTTLRELEELAEAMRITLFTVSYRAEPDRKLAWLVRKTGGRHYDASSLKEMNESLRDLRREFTSAYRMVYAFPFKGAGSR